MRRLPLRGVSADGSEHAKSLAGFGHEVLVLLSKLAKDKDHNVMTKLAEDKNHNVPQTPPKY